MNKYTSVLLRPQICPLDVIEGAMWLYDIIGFVANKSHILLVDSLLSHIFWSWLVVCTCHIKLGSCVTHNYVLRY